MKKVLSLVLLLVFTLGFSVCADSMADDTAAALAVVKERIGNTDEFDIFESNVSTQGGRKSYYFNWSKTGENSKNMSVTINEEMVITNYYAYDNSTIPESKPSVNRLSSDEVMKNAEKLIKQLNPTIADNLRLEKTNEWESLWGGSYRYRIQRYENGIPVENNSGSVRISRDGKTLENFNLSYTQGINFEPVENILEKEAAQKVYTEKVGMELRYEGYETPVLVYVPGGIAEDYVHAVSGEIVNPLFPESDLYFSKNEAAQDTAMGESGAYREDFSAAEKKELENIAGLMGKEKAEKLVRETKVFEIPKDSVLQQFDVFSDYKNKELYYYSMNFAWKDGYARVQINAGTGEVKSFYTYFNPSVGEALAEDDLKNAAVNAAAYLAPKYVNKKGDGNYRPFETSGGNFMWVRYENDIPYRNNSISVRVDQVTGKLTSYNISYSNVEFPKPEGLITAKKAAEKLFEYVDYAPRYILSCTNEGQLFYDKGVPVYYLPFDAQAGINAKSGDFMADSTQTFIEKYTDIEGHYAQTAIETLLRFGVGFNQPAFMPESSILQKDFLVLIVAAFGDRYSTLIDGDFSYEGAYETAERLGIIKPGEKKENTVVTRQEAAVFLIRALGLEPAAEIEGIYLPMFDDVTEKVGYISILAGMGILRGDEKGKFNPAEPISRGDSALVIYNYLSK